MFIIPVLLCDSVWQHKEETQRRTWHLRQPDWRLVLRVAGVLAVVIGAAVAGTWLIIQAQRPPL